jgi:GNAT superfamily N-acetyltransferase
VRIEEFDARTAPDSVAAAYAALVADARAAATPDGLRMPAAYVLNRLRNMPPDHITTIHLAWDGPSLVGATELFWWDVPDNRNRAWLHFDVPPERQSSELLDALAAVAAAASDVAERPLLNVETPVGSALSVWVAERGGTCGSVEQHNVTRLASLSRSDIAGLAAAVPSGYELVTFDTVCPEELMDAFVALNLTMNDAPRDDLTMEDWDMTPQRVRDWEAGLLARGHAQWNVLARCTATGELAGFNQLCVRPDWPECVENEDTAVVRAHRGHGLGLWIKAVNLLRVMDECPSAVCVETWNAASNTHMLRVNRRLGFVAEHVWESWELATSLVVPAASEPQPA